jgi:zinc/manganese transport system substrate-binding protein
MRRLIVAGLLAALSATAAGGAQPLAVVAVESVYGDIAKQIGGSSVTVTSVLANTDQDPHEFEASPRTARALAAAKLVICNGAGYDPWVRRLLSAAPSSSPVMIEVAELAGKRAGDNPHLWYDVTAVSALADALAVKLAEIDPEHRQAYAAGLAAFSASLKPLLDRIAVLRARYAGMPVTATEPLFDYMADALGLAMRHTGFQLAVMNGTEPGAKTVAAFEKDLRGHAVKVLLYNAQTGQALTERMRRVASEAGVPVVTITETLPPGKTYVEWMLSQLDALDSALARR